jgi:hypothetical protein
MSSWSFLEIWVDPMQLPPYLLMILCDESGYCQILDPAEQYKLIKRCDSYDQAQLWLLEDEYEPIKGRLLESE